MLPWLLLGVVVITLNVLLLGARASAGGPTVDLGYGVYQGVTDGFTNLTFFKGIRYAAPPVGDLRWQKPQAPAVNRTGTIDASNYRAQCPQNVNSAGGALNTEEITSLGPSSEDCLFLNVWAPTNASALPVLVWIHGGGYGEGNGIQDMTEIIMANDFTFIGVTIQYRLGAFGFLSSDEVSRDGVVNAGLYDMLFALQWVQDNIAKFGGDPTRVTISGDSAGGGAVMLLNMAYGGTLGSSLFNQSIAASPYLPQQYGYKDLVPSQAYYAFADMAGCAPTAAYGSRQTLLNCLRGKDSGTLIQASQNISASGLYGTWAFVPVTDGELVQELPSSQLQQGKVNGLAMMTGNNANEGASFVPYTIPTEVDLINWLKSAFPLFTSNNISQILQHYPSSNESDSTADALFATNGISGLTALNQSSVATGQQQRAFNIYAETTFVCPSYWLAEAFSDSGRRSWKYQYSVPLAMHGEDVSGYFGPANTGQGHDFIKAFRTMWGNFVRTGDPSISSEIANGNSGSTSSAEAASPWPRYSLDEPWMLNLNETGGVEVLELVTPLQQNTTIFTAPGLQNAFNLVNATSWEGGRGLRCDFWRSMGSIVPE